MSSYRERIRERVARTPDHNPILYCPFCGHLLYPDLTAQKRPRTLIMLCPPERLRITFFGTTHHFSVGVERMVSA